MPPKPAGKKTKAVEDETLAGAETVQGTQSATPGPQGTTQGTTPSKLPETQATITQLFRDSMEDKNKSSSKATRSTERAREEKNIESFLKTLEQKMDKMVTVDYVQKQFDKLITEEFLISKVEQLKKSMRSYITSELDKLKESINARITSLEDRVDSAERKSENLEDRIKDLEDELKTVKDTNTRLDSKQREQAAEIDSIKYAMKVRDYQQNDLEQYTRSNNIRIFGIDDQNKEETAEETTGIVLKFLSNKLHINLRDTDIDIAHRLGKFQNNGNRPIICRFVSRNNKMRVMRNRRALKGSVFVIKED